ncbi:methyl-accepting chemotaxis protein [Paraglaciecola hydrolytica]
MEFETRFNAISQSNLMMEWDKGGKLLELNDYCNTALGIKVEQFRTGIKNWESYLSPSQKEELLQSKSISATIHIKCANRTIAIAATFSSVKKPYGEIAKIIMYGTNITERLAVVQTSEQVMQELQSSGKNINNMVSSINAIAEQTNLLALNAAIEAARAGEAGRGFSVVADEVRNLASKAGSSASEINTVVSKNQALLKSLSDTLNKLNASQA